jgi:hypothetical protein
MGSEFSKNETIEYGQYRNIMDQALRDQEPYTTFIKIRDQLADELKTAKPNVHRYVVAYAKKIIKSKKVPNHIKFNALLLLKELMKTRSPQIISYNQKKFMYRLRKLSTSPNGPKVLLEYNARSSPADSAKFYQLLMESLLHWGNELGAAFPAYADAQNRLIKMGRLPIPDVYYDVPRVVVINSAVPQPEVIPDIRNTLDAFKFERVRVLELIQYKGQEAFEDAEVQTEFRVYEDEKRKLDNNPFVQSLLANATSGSAKDQELAREFGNEIMMYDALKEAYQRTDPYDLFSKQRFFSNVEETHRNLFGSTVNFAMKTSKDPRFDSPHEDIMVSRDRFSQGGNGAGLMASGLQGSNVYADRRPEDLRGNFGSNRDASRQLNAGGAHPGNQYGDYDTAGRNGVYASEVPPPRAADAHQFGDNPTTRIGGFDQLNSQYNSRRDFADDVNDVRVFNAENRQGHDRPLSNIPEDYEHELGTRDRNVMPKHEENFLSQPQGPTIPAVEVEIGRDRRNKQVDPMAAGRNNLAGTGRSRTPELKDTDRPSSFRLNHLKTETSNRASRHNEDEIRNPYRGQSGSNSKEFYKEYFKSSGHQLRRSSHHKDYQFETDAMRFVNGVYADINNTVAKNTY